MTSLGVTPWRPGEAELAAAKCFEDWCAQRATSGNWDEAQAITAVVTALIAHGNSRFQHYDENTRGGDPSAKIPNRLGFRTVNRNGETEYILQPPMMREMCNPFPEQLVARARVRIGAQIRR